VTHTVALVLVAIGCGVITLSALGAVTVGGDMFTRLHFLTPVTSLGAPVVCVGLCIESRQPWVVAEMIVIALMLFVAGPVLESSTARAYAQVRGVDEEEQPA
jgi:multicomponent Na+:H+ antiporter subunit G